jgi:hypothetical protein
MRPSLTCGLRRGLSLAGLVLGIATPAAAQEWDVQAQLTLLASAIDDKSPFAPSADGPLATASLVVARSDTFENGLTVEWRAEGRFERDAPSRPSFAGVLGDCPAANPLCPRLTDGAGAVSPVSPATGLAPGGGLRQTEGFVTLEGASVSLSGPWGEGVLGYDSGAAARLDARAPTVLQRASAFTPGLDATGLVTARARNDVTGSSPKATYMSPRWLGLRLGASYTPEANQRTADFDPHFGGAGLGRAELQDVWEAAASFARQFADQGFRVRTAITYTSAVSGSALIGFGDYEAWGAGWELETGAWTGGVRWLSSNNAWHSGNGDYEAWEAGLVHQAGEWRIGIEGGWAEDQLSGTEGASWLVGASRKINDNLDLGLAWTSAEADVPVLIGPSRSDTNAENDGLVVELTIRN